MRIHQGPASSSYAHWILSRSTASTSNFPFYIQVQLSVSCLFFQLAHSRHSLNILCPTALRIPKPD